MSFTEPLSSTEIFDTLVNYEDALYKTVALLMQHMEPQLLIQTNRNAQQHAVRRLFYVAMLMLKEHRRLEQEHSDAAFEDARKDVAEEMAKRREQSPAGSDI
jgi:predicted transcriptional regulator